MQSSSSDEWMPRWWDRLWCLTMVVFRQKLTSWISITSKHEDEAGEGAHLLRHPS